MNVFLVFIQLNFRETIGMISRLPSSPPITEGSDDQMSNSDEPIAMDLKVSVFAVFDD
jgi:hypothetical protein